MSSGWPFALPWIEQTSDERVSKVSAVALERLAPDPTDLRPHCVPTPFAEAEVMTTLLRALPSSPAAHFEDPKHTDDLRQTFQRWQLLLKATLLGKVSVENVPLRDAQVDNFGKALRNSRSNREYQGVLRSHEISALNPVGRRSRLVGALDEGCLVWAAPRLHDGEWGILANTISGAEDNVALDLLAAWRGMLTQRNLWNASHWESPWMKGVDRMLEGHKPSAGWAQLEADLRQDGPVRLNFPHNAGATRQIDVYLPVYHRGFAASFQKIFRLRPVEDGGNVSLVEDAADNASPRLGSTIQLSGVQRSSLLPGSSSASVAADKDVLLAGLGKVETVDAGVMGERWWLSDRNGAKGYGSTVYKPLMDRVILVQGSRLPLTADDVVDAPCFFPDALRIAQGLLSPPAGKSGIEFVTLKEQFPARVRHWSLPMYGEQLVAGIVPPPRDQTFALALEVSPSAPCLLERLAHGSGEMLDVAELRALGALLWEVFVGEVEFKGANSLVRTPLSEEGVGKVASQAQEAAPRIIFDDALLAVVGSVLSDHAGRAEPYRARSRRRRATAQRFAGSWRAAGSPLGALAARTFVDWVFDGFIDEWGRAAKADDKVIHVTRSLSVPWVRDVYPRKVG